jgi:hypothetical protein
MQGSSDNCATLALTRVARTPTIDCAHWPSCEPRPRSLDQQRSAAHTADGGRSVRSRVAPPAGGGQLQPVTVAAEISMKQTSRLAAMPACGRTPSLRPNRGTCDLPSSGRADLESVGVLRTLHQGAAGCVVAPMIGRDRPVTEFLCVSMPTAIRSGTDSNDIASQRF